MSPLLPFYVFTATECGRISTDYCSTGNDGSWVSQRLRLPTDYSGHNALVKASTALDIDIVRVNTEIDVVLQTMVSGSHDVETTGDLGQLAFMPFFQRWKTVFVGDGHICVLWLLPIRHSNECIMMTSLDKFMLHYGSIFCSWRHNYQRVTSSKKIYIINWSVFCNHQSRS